MPVPGPTIIMGESLLSGILNALFGDTNIPTFSSASTLSAMNVEQTPK